MDSNNWRVKRDPSDAPPRSPFSQRATGERTFGRGGFDQRSSPGRFQSGQSAPSGQNGQSREGFRKPMNDAAVGQSAFIIESDRNTRTNIKKAEQAIEEGRRLYVGNMPYEATVKDVESLFKDISDGIQAINMSVDPMTGRNPSYCFVDFKSKELAERIMEEYNGVDFLRRPLKVKPGVKSGSGPRFQRSDNVQFGGRFESNRVYGSGNTESTPAKDRWNRLEEPADINVASREGRRLYVGGLPRFENQVVAHSQIRELFSKYDIQVISKPISAHESTKDKPGNHNYLFVDLASAPQANDAIQDLDGMLKWGWNIKVRLASGTSNKLGERRRLFIGGLPQFPDQEATELKINELFDTYDVSTISKLFLPRETVEPREGNHSYCFVELADEEQTDKAIVELDWKEKWGGNVRVKPATTSNPSVSQGARRGWGSNKSSD